MDEILFAPKKRDNNNLIAPTSRWLFQQSVIGQITSYGCLRKMVLCCWLGSACSDRHKWKSKVPATLTVFQLSLGIAMQKEVRIATETKIELLILNSKPALPLTSKSHGSMSSHSRERIKVWANEFSSSSFGIVQHSVAQSGQDIKLKCFQ